MIATALTFLASPIGKLVGYAVAALSVAALALILLAAHDHRVRAADALAVQQATAAAQIKTAQAALTVALRERDDAIHAAAEAATIKGAIGRAAQGSKNCFNSAGARAMLNGLQPDAGGGKPVHPR